MASEGLQELLDMKNNPLLDRRSRHNMWAALVRSLAEELEPLAREPCLNVVEHGEPCFDGYGIQDVTPESLCLTCRLRQALKVAVLKVPASKWEV